MAQPKTLSVDDAWNAVALEERFELLTRAQAEGILASAMFILLISSVAYGFDKLWLLLVALVGGTMVLPLFSSQSWRRTKPAAILSYLAVRSVARRYAYGFKIVNLDFILIFRAILEERFDSKEEEELNNQKKVIDFHTIDQSEKDVWVCLMRGGIVILSEKIGGAKLEFISPITPELECRAANSEDQTNETGIAIVGTGPYKGKKILLRSKYPAALYVFERQTNRLISEAVAVRAKMNTFKENYKNQQPIRRR